MSDDEPGGKQGTVLSAADVVPLDPVRDLRRIMARVAWRAEPVIALNYDEATDILVATALELPGGGVRFAHDDLRVRLDGHDDEALPTEIRLARFTGAQRSPAALRSRQLLGSRAWRAAVRLSADGGGATKVLLDAAERDVVVQRWNELAAPVRVVGVQILPEEVRGVVVDEVGTVLDARTVPVKISRPDVVVAAVVELLDQLGPLDHDEDWCRALGLQIGGPVDQAAGVVHDYNKAGDHADEWSAVALRSLVTEATGLPAVVLNDVVALAVHEQWFGLGSAAGAVQRYGVLLAADGIGGASVVGGRVDPLSPMELGNFVMHREDGAKCRCGKSGCVEATVGEWAIVRDVAGGTGQAVDDLATARDYAESGADAPLVREVFHQAGRDLAAAIGSVQVLNNYAAWVVYFPAALPEKSAAGAEFRRGMEEFALWVSYEPYRRCRLVVRTVADEAHARGAALSALESFGLSSSAAAASDERR
jgi:predicted NBD/HSP70 family sugar kinase